MPHIHDKIDFTVEVFVVYKNKVLLRRHDKYNMWLSVGGHIELDEDPNEAALREVKEEVGLDIELYDVLRPFEKESSTYKELIPPFFMNRHAVNKAHKHVTLSYFAIAKTNRIKQTSSKEKSEECRWFTKGDLLASKELSENVRFYALKALEKLSPDQKKRGS